MSLKEVTIATIGALILNTTPCNGQDKDLTNVSNHEGILNMDTLERKVKHFNSYPYSFQNELTVEYNNQDTIFKIIMYDKLGHIVKPRIEYDKVLNEKHLIKYNTTYLHNDEYYIRFEGKTNSNKLLLEINKVVKY